MDNDKFIELYNECFNSDGTVKLCGRAKCKKLLTFLNNSKYGDKDLGFLNVKEINALYHSITNGV